MSKVAIFAADALKGRRALVWGASLGIGLASAEQLARMGAEVVLLARSEEKLRRAAEEIGAAGYEAVDLTDEHALAAALERHADIDILVTNCGGPPIGPYAELPLKAWDEAYQQIIRAVVQATQFLLPRMAARGFGRIIMIASRTVQRPLPNLAISNALRRALVGIAETIAGEYASCNITANLVCPGLTRTARMEQMLKLRAEKSGRTEEEVLRDMLKSIAAARPATPEEIAAAVGFLATDAAAYMQAQCLIIDGGEKL
jgi:3-oxoacyl-[acyl-carrier protein] reductase